MKTLFNAFLIASICFGVYSCKDKANDPEPAKSNTDLLCASSWKLTAVTVDPPINVNGTPVSDWFSQFDPCDKDDLTKYNKDNTGVYDDGPTKCYPSDPQTRPFTWSFGLNDETKLSENGVTYDVEILTESTLRLSFLEDGDLIGGESGLKYKLTGTFKH